MRLYAFLFLLLCAPFAHGQDKPGKKPDYVILVNGEISSKEKVDEYARQGYIKDMTKGVSDEAHAALLARHGSRIGEKEFIILISVYTEEEIRSRTKPIEARARAEKPEAKPQVLLDVKDLARDFTVDMLDGSSIKLSDLKGKVVLLNFWATWCAPCLLEFHDFPAKIIAPYKHSAFVLLPVSRGEAKEKVMKKMTALKKNGIDFNVGIDPDETIWSLYAQGGIPLNFLIDRQGVIRYVSEGYKEENIDKLAAEIQKLLDE